MVSLDGLALSKIALSDFSIRVLLLLSVILLDKFISLPSGYHPKLFFRYLTKQIALKVNKRSKTQQRIAGQLTLLLLTSLTLGFTGLILFFAAYPWFFQFIILLLIISSKPLFDCTQSIEHSLKQGHKILAREQLQQLCIRDTTNLSTIGIIKATIEALPQRLVTSYFSPILIFACFGIYPTVIAVTLGSIAQQYNPKHLKFRYFGTTATLLTRVISLPAQLIVALNVYLLFGAKTSLNNLIAQAKQWHSFGNGLTINVTAWALNCSLGGAVSYQGIKIRRPKLGTSIQPSIENINDVYRVTRQAIISWLCMLLLAFTTSLLVNTIVS